MIILVFAFFSLVFNLIYFKVPHAVGNNNVQDAINTVKLLNYLA